MTSASDGPARPPASVARPSVTGSALIRSGAADAAEGVGCRTGALRLPTAAHPVAAGGLGRKPQAHLPDLPRRGTVDPAQAA